MVPFPGKEGTRPVGTGAERRRVGCWGNAPHSECGGVGHDRTWRSSRPCYARRLNFHVRLVCAHSPNSPVGVASAPFGATSAGVVRRLGRNGLKRPRLLRIFALASACSRLASRMAAFACSTTSLALRFLLLAARRPAHSLWPASLHPFTLRGGVKHRTLR